MLWGARLESSFVNGPCCAGGIATASSLSRPHGGTFGVSRAGLAVSHHKGRMFSCLSPLSREPAASITQETSGSLSASE